jgi:hypothetical protein
MLDLWRLIFLEHIKRQFYLLRPVCEFIILAC